MTTNRQHSTQLSAWEEYSLKRARLYVLRKFSTQRRVLLLHEIFGKIKNARRVKKLTHRLALWRDQTNSLTHAAECHTMIVIELRSVCDSYIFSYRSPSWNEEDVAD